MELLPVFILGGLFMSINDTPSSENAERSGSGSCGSVMSREGYQNANTNPSIPRAYPNESSQPNVNPVDSTHTPYLKPNNADAKYFDQNAYFNQQTSDKNPGNTIQKVYSLTGSTVDKSEFKHNNMVAFQGGKSTQHTIDDSRSNSILDNMNGNGTQHFRKQEQAPLFTPEKDLQLTHGQSNRSDFFQSRVNSGTMRNHSTPFQSEQVGPALGAGYGTAGEGGFNSGMQSRESYMPKSVDELRVATNPKMEYSLDNHQGPAASHVNNIGIMGKMEQHKPDTFFTQTKDQWLTTTGASKAATARSKQEVHDTMRMHSEPYSGIAGSTDKNANYVPGVYQESTRHVLENKPVTNVRGVDAGFNTSAVKNSFYTPTNNRDLNRRKSSFFGSGIAGAIGAVIAPITDMLNPTKKQETINNMRVYGNAGTVVQHERLHNATPTPTTVKETTMYAPNAYMQTQGSDAYLVAQHQPIENHRTTTTHSVMGGAGGASTRYGDTSHMSANNQTNNERKEGTVVGRTNSGNTQRFNPTMNVNIAKTEEGRRVSRSAVPSGMSQRIMSKEMHGQMRESVENQQDIGVERNTSDILDAFKRNPYTHSLHETR